MDKSHAKFILFGGLHLGILFLTVAVPAALSLWTRRCERPSVARWLAVVIGTVLLLDRFFAVGWGFHAGTISRWQDALPMHLCDWATFVVIYALFTGGQRAYETAYYWGLAGTLQAVLTPDLNQAFPDPLFFSFFISHCGIIVAVLFLTWGLKKRPTAGSWIRTWLWSQFYLVCAGTVNWLCGTNFGYLAAKPAHASLLDTFAPWPWYILELEALALILYGVLYLPFCFRRDGAASGARTAKAAAGRL